MCAKRRLISVVFTCAAMMCLSSCATHSKVYPPISDDIGVLRLGEVVYLATRNEILTLGMHYQNLIASGISEDDIHDGSLVAARVYCCGGNIEESSAPLVYVPPGLHVEVGDIIEIKMGRAPSGQKTGSVNTATSIRQRGLSAGSCRWIPDNPSLWMRVLYCDWMKDDGWVEREGLYNTWLKR